MESMDNIDGLLIEQRPVDGVRRLVYQIIFCRIFILVPAHVTPIKLFFLYFLFRHILDTDPKLISSQHK